MKNHSFYHVVTICMLLLLGSVLFHYSMQPNYFTTPSGGDYYQYKKMATSLLINTVSPPFKYRILFPLLASWISLLGVNLTLSFFLINIITAWFSCILFYYYLKYLGFSHLSAIIGSSIFAATCGGFLPMRAYGVPDTLTNGIIILILILIISQHTYFVMGVITLGVLAKESVLMLLPIVFIFNKKLRNIYGILSMTILPISVYISIRLLLPTEQHFNYFSLENFSNVVLYWNKAAQHGILRWILWAFSYSLGPVWLIGGLNIKQGYPFIKKMSLYIFSIILPLFLTTDTDRALYLFFPVVIPLALCSIENMQIAGFQRKEVIANGFVIMVLISQLTYYYSSPVKHFIFISLCIVPIAFDLMVVRRKVSPESYFRLNSFGKGGRESCISR